MASIGHPVMGDPRYGRHNKNREGICLAAVDLRFECPLSGRRHAFRLEETHLLPALRIVTYPDV